MKTKKSSVFNKGLATLLAVLMLLMSIPLAVAAETVEDTTDYIKIYTVEDLYLVRNDMTANYILMNDIDLTEATAKGGLFDHQGYGWRPLGSNNDWSIEKDFFGIFDGNGHKIIGMRIEIPDIDITATLGLFNTVTGTVKNLGMESGSISGGNALHRMGFVAGSLGSKGNIVNCYNTGSIDVSNSSSSISSYVGGIVGYAGNSSGVISKCYNTGSIQANYPNSTSYIYIGGIAGYIRNSTISECYNTGNVTLVNKNNSSYAYAGGIVGYAEAPSSGASTEIRNCYNTGCISAATSGGIAGVISYSSPYGEFTRYAYVRRCYTVGEAKYAFNAHAASQVKDCYYANGKYTSNIGATALYEAQLKKAIFYSGFDFENVWYIEENSDYPYPQLQAFRCAPHDWNEGEITAAPTYTAEGKRTYTCADCGTTKTEPIPMLPPSPDAPQLTINNAKAFPGSTFSVTIDIANNPGFAYLAISLSYDAALTLIAVDNGNVLVDMDEGLNLIWSADNDSIVNGTLATLTFKVSENAVEKDYTVAVTVYECCNTDNEEIYFVLHDGTVKVSSVVYGDTNADGLVNGQDLLLLRKYLANLNYVEGTSTVAVNIGADANGDGTINGRDLLLLRKYLANLDYTTGVSTVVLGPVA